MWSVTGSHPIKNSERRYCEYRCGDHQRGLVWRYQQNVLCWGTLSPGQRLVDITYQSMVAGIKAVRPGATLGDIGASIQQLAEGAGFSVVREYCGHGVGQEYHTAPQVLHYGIAQTGMLLKPGMIFTIEPMINAGKAATSVLSDGWTVVTKDRSLSAQWEHTIAVTESGYDLLTPWPEGTGEYEAI